jgi:hypothetical protein
MRRLVLAHIFIISLMACQRNNPAGITASLYPINCQNMGEVSWEKDFGFPLRFGSSR